MISTDLDPPCSLAATAARPKARKSRRRHTDVELGLACVGALLAAVLVPKPGLGASAPSGPPPTVSIPGGAAPIPQSYVQSYTQQYGPITPWGAAGVSRGQPGQPDTYHGPQTGPEVDGAGCLRGRTLSGVVASNDREAILRFGRASFYRVRLTRACPALLAPGAHVAGVTRSSGGLICNPFDVELKVVAANGAVSRCTGDTLRRMSATQVSAAAH